MNEIEPKEGPELLYDVLARVLADAKREMEKASERLQGSDKIIADGVPSCDEAERPSATDAGSFGSGFTMEARGRMPATHVGGFGMRASSGVRLLVEARVYGFRLHQFQAAANDDRRAHAAASS